MCVSLHPARFSDTIVGIFEKDGRRYLAYQNTAANLISGAGALTRGDSRSAASTTRSTSRRRSANVRSRSGNWSFEDAVTPEATSTPAGTGNAMILPIPDDVDNIEIIDTATCPNFLKDIRTALTPRSRGSRGVLRGSISKGADSVRIIDVDIYRVVIAANARAIVEVLKSDAIPDDKRPALNQKIINAYAKWYPNWAISVWCFNNTEARRAKPTLLSYEPTKQDDPDIFFVPTLDAHTGDVPDLNAHVDVDHTIFVASEDMDRDAGSPVYYSDRDIAAGINEILPASVMGKVISGEYRNGDVVFRRSDLAAGKLVGLRALPPGAKGDSKRVFI